MLQERKTKAKKYCGTALLQERECKRAEAESKEKHGVWGLLTYLTITYLMSTPESTTMGNPMPELALILCQSRLYPPVKDLGFALRTPPPNCHKIISIRIFCKIIRIII
jgi:hypothetical protein